MFIYFGFLNVFKNIMGIVKGCISGEGSEGAIAINLKFWEKVSLVWLFVSRYSVLCLDNTACLCNCFFLVLYVSGVVTLIGQSVQNAIFVIQTNLVITRVV